VQCTHFRLRPPMSGGDTMTWFKVDDGFWSHPKTLGLSKGAVALWVRSGAYAGQHLTDGVIPRHVLGVLQGTEAEAQELVTAGLWLDHVEGYLFHDWNKYQPTKAKVETDRAKTAERVAAWRDRNKENESETSPFYLKEDNPTRPDPTRPQYVVTNGVSNGVTPTVTDFDEFWNEYPRKQGKEAARKAFAKAATIANPEAIIEGAKRYASDPNRKKEFTAHAATWLNAGRWDDEPEPERDDIKSKSQARMERNVAAMANWEPIQQHEWWELTPAAQGIKEVGR